MLSRTDMYKALCVRQSAAQKSAGRATLTRLTDFVTGPELPARLTDVRDDDTVPPRRMDVTYAARLGPPVKLLDDVVPETRVADLPLTDPQCP